jgi:hypothetical protein
MTDSFTSPASKILSIGKKLAPLAGIAHAFLGDPMGDGRGIEGAPSFMMQRLVNDPNSLLHGHIGNPLITTQIALAFPDKYPIFTGAAAAITGYLMEAIGGKVDGSGAMGQGANIIGGFGTILKRYGVSAALGSIVSAWLYLTPFNPHGTPGYSQGANAGASSRDTVYRSETSAHIRNAAGSAAYVG